MARTPTKTTPEIDPLANLRAPESTTPALPVVTPEEAEEAALEAGPAPQGQEWHDAAVSAVVARWHGDRVAVRYGHKGGSCGCRYLASLALLEAVGYAGATEEDEAEDGDGSDG